jgi:uncharacterized protein (TIGR02145 family)
MKKIILFFAGLSFLAMENQAQKVADYDGNEYDTIYIGNLVWFKQNLKTTHYSNGLAIPLVTDTLLWASLTTGARCYYANDSATYDSIYGPLYNWYTVNNPDNVCPDGWRVPTNAEWEAAEGFLGGAMVAGGAMKEEGTLHWLSPNVGATNSSGFTGLPGGMRDPVNNNFRTLAENGLWWTSTAFNGASSWSTYLWYMNTGVDHNPVPRKFGLSIRCVRDVGTRTGDPGERGNIRIWPVPAQDKVTIEHARDLILNLQVFNMAGECVMQGQLKSRSSGLDISTLPAGIYMVKIFCRDWTVQRKLVKE